MASIPPGRVFCLLVAFRLFNALALRTFFQPDEYFQALEPAWRMAFGPASGAWMTWEWHHQLRSSLHPALFALAYALADRLSSLLPVLRPAMLLIAPRILQAVLAAGSDWGTWKLACSIYGHNSPAALTTLILTISNPWQWYCSTRTFSNSLETTLTALALSLWPWPLFSPFSPSSPSPPLSKENSTHPAVSHFRLPGALLRLRLSLALAALAAVLRPTNVLLWLPIAASTVGRLVLASAPVAASLLVLCQGVLCGVGALMVAAVSDRAFFGEWAFPPYNWLYFNLSQSLAVFYGRNDWHYYLSQGVPLLATTSLPFVLVGLARVPPRLNGTQRNSLHALTASVLTTIGALSLIAHKEVRFVYPLLPILMVLAAPYAASFFTQPSNGDASTSSSPSSQPTPRLRHKAYLVNAVFVNLLLAVFLSVLHQPAPLAVLSFLRGEYARTSPDMATASPASPPTSSSSPSLPGRDHRPDDPPPLFALFLTPCHSTPWRSHLLYPGLAARALTCEPPLHTAPGSRERAEYRDEADRFYDDPVGFVARELWPSPSAEGDSGVGVGVPRYIVGFEGIEPWLGEFFASDHGKALGGVTLERAWEGWNGYFSDDPRRAGKLVAWKTKQINVDVG